MLGIESIGIQAPIYKGEGNILDFICNAIQNSGVMLNDGDILGITESLVARSQNNYCTIDDIAVSVKRLFPDSEVITLFEPIASRNRFSYILKGIARIFKQVNIIWMHPFDEVGNYIAGKHPFTGIDYRDFYTNIVASEGSHLTIYNDLIYYQHKNTLDCRCHVTTDKYGKYTLSDILNTPITRADHTESGFNPEYGILGSNVAGDDRLKLFPRNGQEFVTRLQKKIELSFNKDLQVLIFGDGCYKDASSGIWEYADPITCPGTTISWDLTPKELKIKLLAENKSEEEIIQFIKESEEQQALGTTPRKVNDLLASLMDLTSGSGDKGTPIVLVKNYFTHYGN